VAGSCEYYDEPPGSGAMELISYGVTEQTFDSLDR
jgi:hypothetical protein